MRKSFLRVASILTLSITFAVSAITIASAKVPHGFSKGNKVGWHHSHVPPGWSKGNKVGWHHRHVPPGWSKGNKVGWR